MIDIGYFTGIVPLPTSHSDTNGSVWAIRKSATGVQVWRYEVSIYSYEFEDSPIKPECKSRWYGNGVTDGIIFNPASSPGIYIGTLVGR